LFVTVDRAADLPLGEQSRRIRLRSIAHRLEAILAELDDLGLQRIAIDVCMALERVKARIAEGDTPDPEWH